MSRMHGQLLAGRRRDDGLVVAVLREGLDLDLVLALALVVVVDDRRDGRELGLVAGVVRPHRQLAPGAAGAGAAALGAGGHGEGQRRGEQADGDALGGGGELHRFLRGGKVSVSAKTFQPRTVAALSNLPQEVAKTFSPAEYAVPRPSLPWGTLSAGAHGGCTRHTRSGTVPRRATNRRGWQVTKRPTLADVAARPGCPRRPSASCSTTAPAHACPPTRWPASTRPHASSTTGPTPPPARCASARPAPSASSPTR